MSRASHKKAMAEANIGNVVAGRYRLEQLLGVGGMAEVFRAEDVTNGRHVAVKLLRADIASNPEAVERTKREGELLSELHHPAIVSVESWGQLEEGTVFLVMELLEGETLGARMRRGVMEPTELAPIVAGTCAGLHAAHARGIVHRDLKPDNIFLCPTDHGLQVKLLDFGISKFYGRERLTQTGEVLGTPRYMSPEQLGAESDVDVRVDIYALGVILYEALAGKPPFLASTPTDLIIAILHGKVAPLRSARPDVPPNVEAVVMRAFAKPRQARFDTAMALAEAYIDSIGGVAEVRGAQRRGMATRAMGGMKVGGSAPPPPMDRGVPSTQPPKAPRSDEVAGNLRLGTFSGLSVDPEPPSESAPAVPNVRTAQMGASQGSAIPEDPGVPVASRPQTEDGWIAQAPTVRAMPATRSPEERLLPQTRENEAVAPPEVSAPRLPPTTALEAVSMEDVAPPKRSGRLGKVVLVVSALLAGALSAAAVIVALHYYDASRRPEPIVREPEQPAPREEEAPRTASVPEAEAQAPDAVDPVPAEPVREAQPTAERVPTKHRPREAPIDPLSDLQTIAHDPLREAQRALRGGDPTRCIEILDEAIRSGNPRPGPIVLRRRGDCYEAAGRRADAISDYQRFCAISPDHPAIGELRPLLESWGRSCP